jgi:cysteinyl-tRNA synthetase
MVSLIETLLTKGVAYRSDDGSIYFAIGRFPAYGRLSQLDKRELKAGARVASDDYAKDDPRDFALWKQAVPLDEQVGAAWDAPFGRGRPGWHIECSGMSLHEIGTRFGVQTLDIHAGGVDNIFPHHEDEIAQSEASTGQTFARHWLHGAFLNVKGTKMSKRFGNFLTVRDLQASGVDPATFRYLVFSTHYRQPLDYTDEALDAATEGARRLVELRERLAVDDAAPQTGAGDARLHGLAQELDEEIRARLDDDLNAPPALAALFDFVRAVNRALDAGDVGSTGRAAARAALEHWVGLFDILPTPKTADAALAAWVEERIQARDAARKSKRFKDADHIREELRGRGVELEDTPGGSRWRLV